MEGRFFSRAGVALICLPTLVAQEAPEVRLKRLEAELHATQWELGTLRKATDDILWFQRLSDIAEVDKVTYVGPPNPRAQESYGIKNERHPMKVHQYVFVPRKLDKAKKHPLLVLPHGGVHGDFGTSQWTFTGTAADGSRIETDGIDVFTFKDGKIQLKNVFRKARPNLPAAK